MAIAFDAKTDKQQGAATSLTFSHTCTGSNLILFVGAQTGDNLLLDQVTGITYNSVAMTRACIQNAVPSNSAHYLYYLLNPSTGANNVVISVTGGSQTIRGMATSYTGVGGGFDVTATNAVASDGSNPMILTTNIDPVSSSGAWAVVFGQDNQTDLLAGTGLTMRTTQDGSGFGMYDTNGIVSGSVNLGLNVNSGSLGYYIASCVASFKATAVVGPANMKTWDGLASASVKTMDGLAIASVKTWDGLA